MKTKHTFVPPSFGKTLPEATALLTKDADAVAEVKGRDYREGSQDLLANFRQSAEEAGISPLQAWLVFFGKHRSAIASYIKTGGRSQSEPIHGRFVDAFNYLRLGWLLMVEAELERETGEETLPSFASVDHFPGLGAEIETRDGPEDPWVRSKFLRLFEHDDAGDRAKYSTSIRIEGRGEVYSLKDPMDHWLWRPLPPGSASHSPELGAVVETRDAPGEAWGRSIVHKLHFYDDAVKDMKYGTSIRIEGRSEIYSLKDLTDHFLWRPLPWEIALPVGDEVGIDSEVEIKNSPADPWRRARISACLSPSPEYFKEHGRVIRVGGYGCEYVERDVLDQYLWREIPPPSPSPSPSPSPPAKPTPGTIIEVREDESCYLTPGTTIEVREDESCEWVGASLFQYVNANRDLYPEEIYGDMIKISGDRGHQVYSAKDPDNKNLWRPISVSEVK